MSLQCLEVNISSCCHHCSSLNFKTFPNGALWTNIVYYLRFKEQEDPLETAAHLKLGEQRQTLETQRRCTLFVNIIISAEHGHNPVMLQRQLYDNPFVCHRC